MGLAGLEKALGQCFNFGFRVKLLVAIKVVEIMETFETNLETCFSNRSYA